jgi:hypothetical protein
MGIAGGSEHSVGPVMQPIVVGCMGTIRMCIRKRWLRLDKIRVRFPVASRSFHAPTGLNCLVVSIIPFPLQLFFLDEADSYFDGTEGEIVEMKRCVC